MIGPSADPYIAGIAAGFVIGALGHALGVRALVILGILVIGATSAAFVIATDPAFGAARRPSARAVPSRPLAERIEARRVVERELGGVLADDAAR